MDENKNALAELAERMSVVTSRGGDTWRWLKDVIKAQRIVAELAKVRDTNWSAGYNYPEPNSSSVAISKCREIAEAGTEDGK